MPTTDEGSFYAAIPLSLDWFWGEGWLRPGSLNLAFELGDGWKQPNGYLSGISLPSEAQAKRIGNDPFSVGPIEYRYPWHIRRLLPLLVIVLVIATVVLGCRRFFIDRMIRAQDADKRKAMRLVIYNAKEDPTARHGTPYEVSRRKLKLDNSYTLPLTGGNEATLTKLRVTRLVSGAYPSVAIRYQWGHSKKWHQEELLEKSTVALKDQPGEADVRFRLGYS